MHSTQKPMSAISLEASQANFPALQHFFPCNEAVGATTLTDSINGVIVTPSDTAPVFDGTKATTLTIINTDVISEAFQAAGAALNPLLVIMGTYGASNDLLIGAAATDGSYRVRSSIANVIYGGGTPCAATGAFPTTGTDEIVSVGLDRTSTSQGCLVTKTSASAHTAITAGGSGAAAGTIAAPAASMTLTDWTNVYGIAIFHFTSYPDDIEAGLLWMRDQWAAGNKVIYPNWKDKA